MNKDFEDHLFNIPRRVDMKVLIGTILQSALKGQTEKDFGKGPVISYRHEISVKGSIDGGDETTVNLSKFTKSSDLIAKQGDKVVVVFSSKAGKSKDGKDIEYHNIDNLTIKSSATQESPVAEIAVAKPTTIAPKAVTHTHVQASSKDVSMEVSGLLQALINSGLGSDLDALESKLRAVLELKRRVAKEFE